MDEATDVSSKDQLVVCIKRIDTNYATYEDPVELIHIPKTDSSTLTDALKGSLIRFCLLIPQCCGQAYDGTSSVCSPEWGCSQDAK